MKILVAFTTASGAAYVVTQRPNGQTITRLASDGSVTVYEAESGVRTPVVGQPFRMAVLDRRGAFGRVTTCNVVSVAVGPGARL